MHGYWLEAAAAAGAVGGPKPRPGEYQQVLMRSWHKAVASLSLVDDCKWMLYQTCRLHACADPRSDVACQVPARTAESHYWHLLGFRIVRMGLLGDACYSLNAGDKSD
jgi:hypothetical protein